MLNVNTPIVKCPKCKRLLQLPNDCWCPCGHDLAPWEPLVVRVPVLPDPPAPSLVMKPEVTLRARRTSKGQVTGWTLVVKYPEFRRPVYRKFDSWLEAMREVDIIHWLHRQRLAPLWVITEYFG